MADASDDDVGEVLTRDERLGDRQHRRADVEQDRGARPHGGRGALPDGLLERCIPPRRRLDRRLPDLSPHGSTTDPAHGARTCERLEVAADGDLCHAEGAGRLCDTHEPGLRDHGLEPSAPDVGWKDGTGLHAAFRRFSYSKARLTLA